MIQAQIRESRDNSIKVFDHKKRVSDILAKYYNKRVVKKRELARL